MVVPFYTPASNEWEIQLFCIFSNICPCRFFNFSHSLEYVVIINYDFIWVPWWLTMLAIFKCVYWLFVYCVCVCVCVCVCEKCLSKTFSHLGIWWIIFFYFLWVLYIIKIQVTFQNMSWILSSSLILAFHFLQCVFGWTALFIIEQQFFSFTVWYINLYILVTHYTDCYNFITSWNQVVKVFQLCFSFPNCFDCLRS